MQSILFWGGLVSMCLSFVVSLGQWFTVSVISHARTAAEDQRYDQSVTDWMKKNEAKGAPEADPGPAPMLAEAWDDLAPPSDELPSVTGWR